MFTGLIEAVQPVKSNVAGGAGRRISIPLGELADDAGVGHSICVNGVCLTISKLRDRTAEFDVMAETTRASTLEHLKTGDMVNLERALGAGDRFGGHMVQGHVDGIGTVDRIEKGSASYVLWIAAGAELMNFMIEKGSVAIEGVSLTIVNVEEHRFSVYLIPTTLEETNLKLRRAGDKVNLEADLISKWICKRLDQILGHKKGEGKLTMESLREMGFS
ncbi:MAG: riboflavin synthase [Sedimentisphaerales bacterium]|nr:riboflavin synthase [Sedimentisphaerales bacterium]